MLQPFNRGRAPQPPRRIQLTVPEFVGLVGALVLFVVVTGCAFHIAAGVPAPALLDWTGQRVDWAITCLADKLPW